MVQLLCGVGRTTAGEGEGRARTRRWTLGRAWGSGGDDWRKREAQRPVARIRSPKARGQQQQARQHSSLTGRTLKGARPGRNPNSVAVAKGAASGAGLRKAGVQKAGEGEEVFPVQPIELERDAGLVLANHRAAQLQPPVSRQRQCDEE